MNTVVSGVIALCLFVAGELTEHRIQPAMSDCLKEKGWQKETSKATMYNTSAVKLPRSWKTTSTDRNQSKR